VTHHLPNARDKSSVSITLDGYTASHRVREIPNGDEAWKPTKLGSSKYLNNLIEQDHRVIKSRTSPMLGFKNFDYAAITIAGVELLHGIAKVNLPCIAYVSKTELRLRSGMQSLLLNDRLSSRLNVHTSIFAPEQPLVSNRSRQSYSKQSYSNRGLMLVTLTKP
jgi:hypothetical protein